MSKLGLSLKIKGFEKCNWKIIKGWDWKFWKVDNVYNIVYMFMFFVGWYGVCIGCCVWLKKYKSFYLEMWIGVLNWWSNVDLIYWVWFLAEGVLIIFFWLGLIKISKRW